MSNALQLTEILASQEELLREAALALPHQFTQCTHALGYIRQAVYLCLTCSATRGICSACSIACHTEHEQVELFPKRHFRCDCPTSTLSHPCTLHNILEEENEENQYGPNFRSVFCRCGRTYNAHTEQETMIQCLACEDWFHESCLNLRERPSSRPTTPAAVNAETDVDANEEDDERSDASSSGLPPPVISGSDYESLVCASCVLKISTLSIYAGTSGIMMVAREEGGSWLVLGKDNSTLDIGTNDDDKIPELSRKRSRSPATDEPEPDAKRARIDPGAQTSCLSPPRHLSAQKILKSVKLGDLRLGAGDIFLAEGFRSRWCKCPSCLPSLEEHPCLLKEEVTYEPPEDPDSGLSLEELGLRALQRIPRDRAIDGIRAFMAMRDDLMQYLRPFAAEGKEVNESDIQEFFNARRESQKH